MRALIKLVIQWYNNSDIGTYSGYEVTFKRDGEDWQ